MNLPPWVTKITTLWAGIGALLILFGSQGVAVPEFVLSIFSQGFVDAVIAFIGAVLVFYQYIRINVFGKAEARVASAMDKTKYLLNPFRT